MVDGSTKSISEVEIGDKVKGANSTVDRDIVTTTTEYTYARSEGGRVTIENHGARHRYPVASATRALAAKCDLPGIRRTGHVAGTQDHYSSRGGWNGRLAGRTA